MQGAPSLAEMRQQHAALAAQGPGSRVFGLLFCQACGCSRPFVSHDAHVHHITDAVCDSCGFVYGRIDHPDINRGERQPDGSVVQVVRMGKKRQPVISEEVAAAAAAALRASRDSSLPRAEPPRPVAPLPDDAGDRDDSRVAGYLRSQRPAR